MNVVVRLSEEQVCEVVRSAASEKARTQLLSGVTSLSGVGLLHKRIAPFLDHPGYSKETLRAVLVYAAFPLDGGELAVTDLAGQLGLAASTTHRYLASWAAVGVLQQDPRTRLYRRVDPSSGHGMTSCAS